MCRCDLDPPPTNETEARLSLDCIKMLNKFRYLMKHVRDDVLEKDVVEEVEHREYKRYLVQLELKVGDAMQTLIDIRCKKTTTLCPLHSLQLCLLRHPESSADMTKHCGPKVKEALRLQQMARYAAEALKQLTEFYDSYRGNAVDTDKAFFIHRFVTSSVVKSTSRQPIRTDSLGEYDACSDCLDATSTHRVTDEQTLDIDTVKKLAQGPRSSLWIEVSMNGSDISTQERPGALALPSDNNPGNTEDNEQSKRALTAFAARVELDGEAQVGYRGNTFYYSTLRGQPSRRRIDPNDLTWALNDDLVKTCDSEVLTAFTDSVSQTKENVETASRTLSESDQLSKDELSTLSALEKELTSISDNPTLSIGTSERYGREGM